MSSIQQAKTSGLPRLKDHLPSRQEMFLLFAAIAPFIHTWALLVSFDQLNALLFRTNIWTALSVLAYALAFALIESLLVVLVFALLMMFVPKTVLYGRRAGLVGLFEILSFLWLIPSWYTTEIQKFLSTTISLTWQQISNIWSILFVLILIGFILLSIRRPGFTAGIVSVLDRLTTLAGFYFILDVICIIVIAIRNLF